MTTFLSNFILNSTMFFCLAYLVITSIIIIMKLKVHAEGLYFCSVLQNHLYSLYTFCLLVYRFLLSHVMNNELFKYIVQTICLIFHSSFICILIYLLIGSYCLIDFNLTMHVSISCEICEHHCGTMILLKL